MDRVNAPPTWEECEAEVAAGTMFRCGHGFSESPCSVCPGLIADRGRRSVSDMYQQRVLRDHTRRMGRTPRSGRSRGFHLAAYDAAALTGERYGED